MTNVVPLRPVAHCDDATRLSRLIRAVATERRMAGDVFWLKENAELLGALASLNADPEPAALAPLEAFHSDVQQTLTDFPQYYRFILSICLDLEELGLPATQGRQLCEQVARAGLDEAELSDLQRAEARRLLRRRGVGPAVGHGELGERLRRFIGRTCTFTLPNRKAAYELTHIVYYLSDYGRTDPALAPEALVSLEYTGLLAFLDQDMDLLAEVCAALRCGLRARAPARFGKQPSPRHMASTRSVPITARHYRMIFTNGWLQAGPRRLPDGPRCGSRCPKAVCVSTGIGYLVAHYARWRRACATWADPVAQIGGGCARMCFRTLARTPMRYWSRRNAPASCSMTFSKGLRGRASNRRTRGVTSRTTCRSRRLQLHWGFQW